MQYRHSLLAVWSIVIILLLFGRIGHSPYCFTSSFCKVVEHWSSTVFRFSVVCIMCPKPTLNGCFAVGFVDLKVKVMAPHRQ